MPQEFQHRSHFSAGFFLAPEVSSQWHILCGCHVCPRGMGLTGLSNTACDADNAVPVAAAVIPVTLECSPGSFPSCVPSWSFLHPLMIDVVIQPSVPSPTQCAPYPTLQLGSVPVILLLGSLIARQCLSSFLTSVLIGSPMQRLLI